jgi:4'-phosphopantetheinyl transferase
VNVSAITLDGGMVLAWAEPTLDAAGRSAALARLSAPERERAELEPRAKLDTFLVGRVLLRDTASAVSGVPAETLTVEATCPDCGGPHGAPSIHGANVFVSLAHCASMVVAVASLRGPVGVDVEERTEASPGRLAAIEALTGEGSLRRWTRTEAILKADGRGLRVDPAELIFDGDVGWVRGSEARYRLSEPLLNRVVELSVAGLLTS